MERVRAHHHDVERVPDADRQRSVPRRARHRLPRELHGRRRGPRLDDDRARGRAVPAQHRRPARGRDDEVGVRPARALRLLHRRVGGALAVAVARAAARLLGRRRRRDRARRQGHVPDGRHPQRRPARPALPHRQEHGVPAREHVPRQRRERRGRRRVQPDVGRALRRGLPRRRRPHRVPARQRVAADRPLAGGERRSCCATAGASTSRGRVHLVERPDQIVPIVCGGLGSLHAIALPSFGESTMQSKPVVRSG